MNGTTNPRLPGVTKLTSTAACHLATRFAWPGRTIALATPWFALFSIVTGLGISATGIADDRLPGDPDPQAAIRVLTSDAGVFEKAKACQRLAIVGDASAVPPLAEQLADEQLATYARTALERIPGPEADNALVAALDELGNLDGPDGQRLAGVIASIGKRRIDGAIERLERFQDSGNATVRAAATRALRKIRTTPAKTEPETDVAFRDSPGSEAWNAAATAESFARFREAVSTARDAGPQAVTAITDVAPELTPPRQVIALRVLAEVGNREGTDRKRIAAAIEPLLNADDSGVAAEAFRTLVALGHFADASSVPDVIDRRAEIAESAWESLASAGTTALDAAVVKRLVRWAERYDSKNADRPDDGESLAPVSGLAAYAAARRLEPATEPLLTLVAAGPDSLRRRCLHAAARTTTAEQLQELIEHGIELDANGETEGTETAREKADRDASDRDSAIESALVRMPPDAAAEVLAAELGQAETAPLRRKLMGWLAFVGGQRALNVVAFAARADDEAMVDAATEALGRWPSADVADTLDTLIDEMEPSKYRVRVIRGYVRAIRQFDMPAEERVRRAKALLPRCDRESERRLVQALIEN